MEDISLEECFSIQARAPTVCFVHSQADVVERGRDILWDNAAEVRCWILLHEAAQNVWQPAPSWTCIRFLLNIKCGLLHDGRMGVAALRLAGKLTKLDNIASLLLLNRIRERA